MFAQKNAFDIFGELLIFDVFSVFCLCANTIHECMICQIRIQFWQSGFLRDKRKERRMKRKEERESRGEEEDEAKNRNYYYCIVCAQSIIVDICGIAHIKSRRRRLEVKANIGAKTRFHPFVFTTPTGKYKSLPRPILMDKMYSI